MNYAVDVTCQLKEIQNDADEKGSREKLLILKTKALVLAEQTFLI